MIRAADLVVEIDASEGAMPPRLNRTANISRDFDYPPRTRPIENKSATAVTSTKFWDRTPYRASRQSIMADSTVLDAVKVMAERDTSALLVMQDDVLVGLVSEADYARKFVLDVKRSKHTRVSEIMTKSPITIDAHKTVEDCMDLMNDKQVQYLCVMRGRTVLGYVTIGDVTRALVGDRDRSIRSLKHYISSTINTA